MGRGTPGLWACLSPNWQTHSPSGPQFTHPQEGRLEAVVSRSPPKGRARAGPPHQPHHVWSRALRADWWRGQLPEATLATDCFLLPLPSDANAPCPTLACPPLSWLGAHSELG